MKISVALCTYNGAQFLRDQLRSIAGQTRLPDEVVICDDGSTDETVNIVRDFAIDSRMNVRMFVNPKNLGSTKNFEYAITLCTGDVITLADQDDIWHPEKLASIQTVFESTQEVGAAFSDANLIDAQGRPFGKTLWEMVGFTSSKQEIVRKGKGFDSLLRGNFVTGATLAFRADLREFLLPIPQGWMHDYWIAVLSAAGSRLDFTNAKLIEYRRHTGQQLGVRDRGDLLKLWNRFRELDNEVYFSAAANWMEVRERLIGIANDRRFYAVAKCEAMTAHLRHRGRLPCQRLRRLPRIFYEAVNGNYFRYSQGVSSILRDILAR